MKGESIAVTEVIDSREMSLESAVETAQELTVDKKEGNVGQ